MQVSVEKQSNKAILEIEIDSEEFEKAVQSAYQKLVRRVNIPGFRKGKAPRSILERYIGRDALYDEALEMLLPSSYSGAIKQAEIEPIDRPDVEILQMEEGKPLKFRATVEVKPEVELGDYMSVRDTLEFTIPPVTSEEVEAQIEELRNRYAELVTDESGVVGPDSFEIVDVKYQLEGQEEKRLEAIMVSADFSTLPKSVHEGLEGARVGETRELEARYPDDYFDKSLAGKQGKFVVTVKEVKRKVLPELTDEFAQTVGKYSSLEELRNQVTNTLSEVHERNARSDYESKVVEGVTKQAKVELPAVLVERQLDVLVRDAREAIERQGIAWDSYLQAIGKDENSFREERRELAEHVVKRELVLEAIAKRENINATEEEVDFKIEQIAKLYDQPVDAIKKFILTGEKLDNLKDNIVREKVVHLLAYGTAKLGHEKQPESQTDSPHEKTEKVQIDAPGSMEAYAGHSTLSDAESVDRA